MVRGIFVTAMLAGGLSAGGTFAEVEDGPIPRPEVIDSIPVDARASTRNPDSAEEQMVRPVARDLPSAAVLASRRDAAALAQAADVRDVSRLMMRVRARDWDNLTTSDDPVVQALGEWHRLRAGVGDFDEYVAFLRDHADWPGLDLLRIKGERSIDGSVTDAQVIAYFADAAPGTSAGALRYGAALREEGRAADADRVIVEAWKTIPMNENMQALYLARHSRLLNDQHDARLDMLLWRGRFSDAEAMFPLVGDDMKALARARIALRRKQAGVDTAIAAVPEKLRADPGLAYERFLWRLGKKRYDSALDLLREQSASGDLGEAEAWANRRRTMARQSMRDDKAEEAYALASQHGLSSGSDYADLEWIAGYVALRQLGKPELALKHFTNHRDAVSSPISLGRAGYWMGRAYEAMNQPEKARAAYAEGAKHQTSFYGQLAAEKIDAPTDPALMGRQDHTGWQKTALIESDLLRVSLMLFKSNERMLGTRFVRQLSETLDEATMGKLARLMLDLDETYAALKLAKDAAQRGFVLQEAYYPVTELTQSVLPVGKPLALSIARRESEFNPAVISPVGARGLMQLMPGTAKMMAKQEGVAYSSARLVTDGPYNARLGSAYLAELIEQFDGNMALVAAGYNAGPGRPRTWMARYGDPRSEKVDPVDWVEHVPFRETRNYIMRVMESIPIYQMRLIGEVQPLRPTEELKLR